MGELLDAAVSPANIMVTILFIFTFIYWITVILGMLDVDFLDFNLDLDADADGISVDWMNNALGFFNLGHIPVMIFFTFLIVPAWSLMIIINDFLDNSSFVIGSLIAIPVFIVSLFVAKILTMPFVGIFSKMGKSARSDSMIGKVCIVTHPAGFRKVGQATVKTDGAPLLLNIMTPEGINIAKGESGLVIEHIKNKNAYLIEPFNQ